MGWFSKKDEVKRDPQTGLLSVKVGDTWIQENPETMVLRGFRKYFRDRNVDFVDAVYLTAFFCGFSVSTVLNMPEGTHPDQPQVQELIKKAMSGGLDAGMEAGRVGQDPKITQLYKDAGGRF